MITPKRSNAFLAYFFSALGVTLTAVGLRTSSLFFSFDSELGYYSTGAVLPIIFNALLVVGVLFFVVISPIWFKKKSIQLPTPTATHHALSIICALICSPALVFNIIEVVKKDRHSFMFVALAILCMAYFLSDLFKFRTDIKLLLSLAFLIDLTAVLAASYFDQNVQMNAPDKILFGIACVSAMLFIVNELRMTVGTTKPAVYLFSAACASLLCATSSIPSIIAYHAGRLPESNGLYSEYYILLSVAVFSILRMIMITFGSKNTADTVCNDHSNDNAVHSEDPNTHIAEEAEINAPQDEENFKE